jgi:hypothetical protein
MSDLATIAARTDSDSAEAVARIRWPFARHLHECVTGRQTSHLIDIDARTQRKKLRRDPYFQRYVREGASTLSSGGDPPLGIRIDKIALVST